jgi:hypothetical protein
LVGFSSEDTKTDAHNIKTEIENRCSRKASICCPITGTHHEDLIIGPVKETEICKFTMEFFWKFSNRADKLQ